MPKKKNFLGGQQNYNPETGEYESALVGPNGEQATKENIGSFKKFKKSDKNDAFDEINAKRMGKDAPKEEESFDGDDLVDDFEDRIDDTLKDYTTSGLDDEELSTALQEIKNDLEQNKDKLTDEQYQRVSAALDKQFQGLKGNGLEEGKTFTVDGRNFEVTKIDGNHLVGKEVGGSNEEYDWNIDSLVKQSDFKVQEEPSNNNGGKESSSLIEQIEKNTEYKKLSQKFKDGTISDDEKDLLMEYETKIDVLNDISKSENESERAKYFIDKAKERMRSDEFKNIKQKIENGEANENEIASYYSTIYSKDIAGTVLENLAEDVNKKEPEVLSQEYLDKFYDIAGGDEDKMTELIRQDEGYQNYGEGPDDTFSMGDLDGIIDAYLSKKTGKDMITRYREKFGKGRR